MKLPCNLNVVLTCHVQRCTFYAVVIVVVEVGVKSTPCIGSDCFKRLRLPDFKTVGT